jgi:hypothetical protein
MKGEIFICWGCGTSGCSMCAVGESKTEQEALKDFADMHGEEKLEKLVSSKGYKLIINKEGMDFVRINKANQI